jgi:bifunctional non-homologous end joining protein LigD
MNIEVFGGKKGQPWRFGYRGVSDLIRGRATCSPLQLPEKKRTQWALTKEEKKNCRWLRPELVAQIEFAEWTPDGHLGHSKFVGLRDDKKPRSVTRK